ncbi:MAG: hypothetical protein AAF907_15540, partial [Planctomycetota bacterium]
MFFAAAALLLSAVAGGDPGAVDSTPAPGRRAPVRLAAVDRTAVRTVAVAETRSLSDIFPESVPEAIDSYALEEL